VSIVIFFGEIGVCLIFVSCMNYNFFLLYCKCQI
jgi:hypothetical protein